MRDTKKNSISGFSLIELMVSLTIFAIVMLVSTTTLLLMVDMNAKAQALYSATTNLSFALDTMTREIRTGYHYNCRTITGTMSANDGFPTQSVVADCVNGNYIAFTRDKDDWQIGYRLNDTRIEQKIDNPVGSVGDTKWVALTADDVIVRKFVFDVSDTSTFDASTDVSQPVVDVLVSGYVNNGMSTNTNFHIQTHIVQRRLDIY